MVISEEIQKYVSFGRITHQIIFDAKCSLRVYCDVALDMACHFLFTVLSETLTPNLICCRFSSMKPEQERLLAVLKDTVSLLCKNSLTFEDQVIVQGLICITVDKTDTLVVPVHERLGQAEYDPCVACGHAKEAPPSAGRKRRRRQRSGGSASPPPQESSVHAVEDDDDEGGSRVKIKKEEEDDDDDEDLIMIESDIKAEESYSGYDDDFSNLPGPSGGADSSYITGFMDNSQLSGITASTNAQHQQQHQQPPPWVNAGSQDGRAGTNVPPSAVSVLFWYPVHRMAFEGLGVGGMVRVRAGLRGWNFWHLGPWDRLESSF